MKRVLLPTDFSENAWNAIAYAVQLLEEEDCKFYILNTYTPVIYHLEYVLVNPAQFGIGDPIRENSERCLQAVKERAQNTFKNTKHSFECIAAFNTLIPEIKEIIDQKNIDLIVMGTTGATGAKEVLFGSNTVHVFKAVNCPVLAIPADFSYENPLEILFPTDFELAFKPKHTSLLADLAQHFHSRIHIMHVFKVDQLTEEQEKHKKDLKNLLSESTIMFNDLEEQSVAEAVSNFQLKWKINLLAMINNKHSFFDNLFFRSNISQIGFHLNVPFLVIPAGL
ncbi:MAG: universal stress protein [Flavobacteriaceae bacterium]|nr:universal stress protein [Bacteroidia bacterium]MBT8287136.1 universal stress protein [Bacteroidia bacterium]NNF74850.1 universal stress protein [Flavobacteriaceae bacterium]NNK72712.1 universal stress protein [Flavobacteriaceae bacterium]